MPGVVGEDDADRPEPGAEQLGPVERVGRLVRQPGRDVDAVAALAERDEVLQCDLGPGRIAEDQLQLRSRREAGLRMDGERQAGGELRSERGAAVDEDREERLRSAQGDLRAVGENEAHDGRLGAPRPVQRDPPQPRLLSPPPSDEKGESDDPRRDGSSSVHVRIFS